MRGFVRELQRYIPGNNTLTGSILAARVLLFPSIRIRFNYFIRR